MTTKHSEVKRLSHVVVSKRRLRISVQQLCCSARKWRRMKDACNPLLLLIGWRRSYSSINSTHHLTPALRAFCQRVIERQSASQSYGRPHIGSNGVSWPPWKKMNEKLKSENTQKSSFLCLCYIFRAIRVGRCRERRYADDILFRYTSECTIS